MKKIKFVFIALKKIVQLNINFVLEVESSGVKNGYPYIKLMDGKVFYGADTKKFKLYFLLSKRIRRKICKRSINLLFDILNRYEYPNTKDYISVGKYYDFKKDDIVLELGAFIGLYAMKASEIVGSKGKVIAVEAVPSNYEIIKLNIFENKIINIIPIQKAIWKETTHINFSITERQRNSVKNEIVKGIEKIKIEASTVDDILLELNINKVDFIFICT